MSDSKVGAVFLAFMRGLIVVMGWAAFAALAVAVLHGCAKPEPMRCQFLRQAGTLYDTDTRELAKTTKLVTVHRDGKTYAFRREDLVACKAAEIDDESR
jgi:hypothetical protein